MAVAAEGIGIWGLMRDFLKRHAAILAKPEDDLLALPNKLPFSVYPARISGIAKVDLDFCTSEGERDLDRDNKMELRIGGRFVMAATIEAVFPVLIDETPNVPDVARQIITGLKEATANLEAWLEENAETADYENAKVGAA